MLALMHIFFFNGDADVVLFCRVSCLLFFVYFCSLAFLQAAALYFSWYCWWYDVSLFACLLVVLFGNYFPSVSLQICVVCFRLEWLTSWLIDWLVDRSIGWLIDCWLHLVLFFGFIWFDAFRACCVVTVAMARFARPKLWPHGSICWPDVVMWNWFEWWYFCMSKLASWGFEFQKPNPVQKPLF